MDPKVGVVVFAAASILKDAVNRIGDLLDDLASGSVPKLRIKVDRTLFGGPIRPCEEGERGEDEKRDLPQQGAAAAR